MSSDESFNSAKDEDFNGDDASDASSEDAPLVSKKASPKKSAKSKKSKRGTPGKKDKKKDKGSAKKKGRVSFELVEKKADKVEEEYEVEAIVGHRQYNGKLMYKIRWKNYGPMDDTWEPYHSLTCPDLLEAYNLKNDVEVPKQLMKGSKGGKKRKAQSAKKSPSKKRRSSVDEESESEGDDDVPYDDVSNDDDEYEVDKIVQMRYKKDGTREFLVHWKRWSKDYDTWEPEANLESATEAIEKFMKNQKDNEGLNAKELRANRKHTDRFTLNTHDSGRRLSKRGRQKLRVTYYDADTDED